jgi:hypothetical protein
VLLGTNRALVNVIARSLMITAHLNVVGIFVRPSVGKCDFHHLALAALTPSHRGQCRSVCPIPCVCGSRESSNNGSLNEPCHIYQPACFRCFGAVTNKVI